MFPIDFNIIMLYNNIKGSDNMRIYMESYMDSAWLLSKDGNEIEVVNHPNENFEFDTIVELIKLYGTSNEQKYANEYNINPTSENKSKLLNIYNNKWCKVRTWGTFGEELTFRITSTNFNWYNIIIEFLLRHKRTNILITVESYKNDIHKIYWDKVPYKEAIDLANQIILENKLISH